MSNDAKSFLARNIHKTSLGRAVPRYEQIGGDFGDAWTYGGTWVQTKHDDGNPLGPEDTPEVVHVMGLESEGIDEPDVYTLEVPAQVEGRLRRENPDEDDYEEAVEEWRMAEFDKLVAAQEMDVYRFRADEVEGEDGSWPNPEQVRNDFDISQEDWDGMSNASKWEAIGMIHGFHELDSYPDKFTRDQLCSYLGILPDKL